MPTECWWYLGAYCLLCYTVGWRILMWVTGLPKPEGTAMEVLEACVWLLSPVIVPTGLIMETVEDVVPKVWPAACWVLSRIGKVATVIGFGGRK